MMPSIAGLNKVFQAALTYLLKTDFSAVTGQPVTLTNGQVLDTVGEGMITGSLTVVETASGSISITGNAIKLIGGTTGTSYIHAVKNDSIVVGDGTIIKTSVNTPVQARADVGILGLYDGTPSDANRVFQLNYQDSTGTFAFGLFNPKSVVLSFINYGIIARSANQVHIAALLCSGKTVVFVKAAETGNVWQIMGVVAYAPQGTLQYEQMGRSQETYIHKLVATETLYPNLVQTIAEDDFSEADGTALSGKALDKGGSWGVTYSAAAYTAVTSSGRAAITSTVTNASIWVTVPLSGYTDVLVTEDHTTVNDAAGTHSVFVLRDEGIGAGGDCIQCWLANGAGGGLTIYERTAGAVASRGATSVSISASTAYACQARVVGTSVYFGVGSSSATGTLAIAEPHTRHGFGLVKSMVNQSSLVDNFKVYPATGYDEVLDEI